jgi:uncharacterized membrane protein
MLHRIGARVSIARILITWGVVAALTGFVHGVHQLYIARFLLGLAEAGYFPICISRTGFASEFLTGLSAAAGIALINSVGISANLSGRV